MNIITVLLVSIIEFVGMFHPLLVHLPIGILLLAGVFQFLSRKEKYQSLSAAIRIALLLGMIGAIASCISGYLLSNTGDYDEKLIFNHQWFGIALACTSVVAYVLNRKNIQTTWVITLMVVLIIITGHLGGSITHGSDYLTSPFSSEDPEMSNQKRIPIPNVSEALVYQDIIRPILTSKCYKCHGPNKRKGKLRLDFSDYILKGGKGGEIIVAGNVDESELIKRIFLSKESDDHMPPLKQPQLTKNEMDLVHWWVSSGADFNKKVKALVQTEKIRPILISLQSEELIVEEKLSDIPEKEIEAGDSKIIQELQKRGVAILPLSQNSSYLSANFVALDSITEKDLDLLGSLKKQLIWLKLGNLNLSDQKLESIAKLSSLTRLSLEHTPITDKGLPLLKNLSQLRYINLIGTRVTVKGISELKELKNLRQIYLYQTSVSGKELNQLKKIFPKTMIDTGGYKLQFFESDTTELKAAKIK